jgi:hypothetical protein
VILHELLGLLGGHVAAGDAAPHDVGDRERQVALLHPLEDRPGEVEQLERLARPAQRRADQPRDVRGGEPLVLGHDRASRPRELHGLGLALVEVLRELHRQRLAPRDAADQREAPILPRALGLVEQLHRREAPAAREQLVGLVRVAGLAHERRVQQAALLDRHRELVDVGQRPDAHIHHRAHPRERHGDRGVRLGGGVRERRAAQVGLPRLALPAGPGLLHLGDVLLGVLELIDTHEDGHGSRPGRGRRGTSPLLATTG